MTRLYAAIGLALAVAGCGGSPTSPSPTGPPAAKAPLAGLWRGETAIRPDGMAEMVVPSEWTLTEEPATSGLVYRGQMRATSAWFASSYTGTLTATPLSGQTYDALTIGNYPSPRGCPGTFASVTTASASSITGSFYGVDCNGIQFNGRISLHR